MAKPKVPKPGLYPEIPANEYHAWPLANYSALKLFRFTPAHVYQYLTDPPDPTPAMELGSATHAAILEPETFGARYVRSAAGDGRSKAVREENERIKAENPGKTLLRDEDWWKIEAMRDAVWKHPRAAELLSGEGLTEASFVWDDGPTGIACKGRVDRVGMTASGWPCVVDYKTFGGQLTRYSVEKAIYDFQYHVQASHYLAGLDALAPFQRRYILLLQEKEPPHCPRLVELDFASLELGRRQIDRWLAQLARCQESGEWPGWSSDFDTMGVPQWAYREEEDADEQAS